MIAHSIILVVLIVSISNTLSAPQQPTLLNRMSKEDLSSLLSGVAPWNSLSLEYPQSSWERLMEAAALIQASDPASVEVAINSLQNEVIFPNDQDQKLFLLMRVVFKLPEHLWTTNRVYGGSWVMAHPEGKSNENPDGSINISWPISWDKGGPKLISGFQGYHGPPYDAALEYRYFRERYPIRDLTAKRVPEENDKRLELNWQRNGIIISIAQCEREAREYLSGKLPSLDWTLLVRTEVLITSDSGERRIVFRFNFAQYNRSFDVFLGDKGNVTGYDIDVTRFPRPYPRTGGKVFTGVPK